MDKRERKPHPEFFVVVLALLVMSFVAVSLAPPAAAYQSAVSHSGGGRTAATVSSFATSITVSLVGDVVLIFVQTFNPSGAGYITVLSVTSSHVTSFTKIGVAQFTCIGSSGPTFCSGAGHTDYQNGEAWFGTANATGTASITVTLSGNTVNYGEFVYDLEFVDTTNVSFVTGTCNAQSAKDCGNPIVTNPAASFTAGSLEISGAQSRGATIASVGTGFTCIGCTTDDVSAYSTTDTSVSSPTDFPASYTGGSGLNSGYGVIGVIFPNVANPATVTVTTTVTTTVTSTLSASNSTQGDGTPTATKTYLSSQRIYFNEGHQPDATAELVNVTAKIGDVKINSANAIVYLAFYQVGPLYPNVAPSASAPLSLIYSHAYTLANGSSDQFLHDAVLVTNPVSVSAKVYYAVAIWTNATACGCSGASGSGVSVYETTGATGSWLDAAAPTLPQNFYAGAGPDPNLDVYAILHYQVSLVTVTSTSSVTVASTVTTVTSTSITSVIFQTTTITSTTLDENLATATGVDYSILALVILLPAFAAAGVLGISTRSPTAAGMGFVAGLALGTGIGNKAGLVPGVLNGIVVLVMIFLVVGIFMSSRSGG